MSLAERISDCTDMVISAVLKISWKKAEPELEKVKKKICKMFKDNGFNIVIETNLYITEYLDGTLI